MEDPPEVLRKKCDILAEAIRCSKHMVVYTGAGISTVSYPFHYVVMFCDI